MVEHASVAFTEAEAQQLGAERIVLVCAEELRAALHGAPCRYECRRDGKGGYVMSASAQPTHQQRKAA